MPAKKDDRLYIRMHIGMPEHPKIEGLSDKAFRVLVETWCWCGRNPQTDGHIVNASWIKRGPKRALTELITAGLFDDDLDGGAIVHDWDDWQRTWDEIREFKETKSGSGAFGAHKRWHVQRGVRDPGCEFCGRMAPAIGKG
jgi:hypothetical protein